MSIVIGYDGKKKELDSLVSEIRNFAARYSDDDWEIEGFSSIVKFIEYAKSKEMLDLVFIDVTNDAAIEVSQWIRKNNRNAVILICADLSISPSKYLQPSIMAAALLLRPFSKEQLTQTLNELFKYINAKKGNGKNDSFVIKTKETRRYISYDNIFYFEARDKKIYLNTLQKEYGFYETIDELSKKLPNYFVRVHRSFIVNSKKIKSVYLSKNLIEMFDDITVPLSKSYKQTVKELNL